MRVALVVGSGIWKLGRDQAGLSGIGKWGRCSGEMIVILHVKDLQMWNFFM